MVDKLSNRSPEPPNTLPATWLGIRRSALIEIVLFLSVALIVDYFFFDGTRYWQTSLHPFWLIVLVVSVQYGTAEGLLAAGMASAALLTGNLPEQAISQDMYEYLFEVSRLPVAWFVISLILGELRMRQVRERRALREDLALAQRRENEIAEAYKQISVVKNKLETRVAGQLRTAITMYQVAKSIEKLEPADVLRGVADVVRSGMKPEKFSFYLLKENLLENSIQEGWSANDRFSQQFTPASSLFREVIGRQRFLCSANAEDEQVLAHEGVLAGPVISAGTGEVLGMLKIEKLGFLDLNFSTVQTFKVLCEWIATAYANARRYEAVRSDGVVNYDTQLLSYGFFSRQTAYLSELAKRIGLDLSMLVVRLENVDDLTAEKRALIPIALGEAVTSVLRKTDLAFEYQRTGFEYAIVLPATSLENAQVVGEKILAALSIHLQGKAEEARFSTSLHCLNRQDGGEKTFFEKVLPKQTEFLARLARRAQFDLSVIEFRLTGAHELPKETCAVADVAMREVLEGFLQSTDPIAVFQVSDFEYDVLLPAFSVHEAEHEAKSLLDALTHQLSRKGIQTCFTYTVQSIHSQHESELEDVSSI